MFNQKYINPDDRIGYRLFKLKKTSLVALFSRNGKNGQPRESTELYLYPGKMYAKEVECLVEPSTNLVLQIVEIPYSTKAIEAHSYSDKYSFSYKIVQCENGNEHVLFDFNQEG